MKSSNAGNPLIQCPFCKKKMKGKTLAGHVKRIHAKDPKITLRSQRSNSALLDGVEIESIDLVQNLKKRHVIDQHGFLVSSDLVPETKMDEDQDSVFHPTGSKRNLEAPDIFEKIKSLDSKIPGARKKKVRPKPNQKVKCPECHVHTAYKDLYNHVKKRHPEQNTKIVLARFNRGYEIWAKNKLK